VSNGQDEQGNWLSRAEGQFTAGAFRLPPDIGFDVHFAGQEVPEQLQGELRRNLRRALDHDAGPLVLARLLVDTILEVARSNPYVGDRLLIGILSKSAAGTPGRGMSLPLRYFWQRDPSGAPESFEDPTYFYVPGAASQEQTLYGPHWTDGNMRIAGVMMAAREEDLRQGPGGPRTASQTNRGVGTSSRGVLARLGHRCRRERYAGSIPAASIIFPAIRRFRLKRPAGRPCG
jgi:hypothetical protein